MPISQILIRLSAWSRKPKGHDRTLLQEPVVVLQALLMGFGGLDITTTGIVQVLPNFRLVKKLTIREWDWIRKITAFIKNSNFSTHCGELLPYCYWFYSRSTGLDTSFTLRFCRTMPDKPWLPIWIRTLYRRRPDFHKVLPPIFFLC